MLSRAAPLTYTLTMKACLSAEASERPSFAQVRTLLQDMQMELSRGRYIDSDGHVQVRHPSHSDRLCHCLLTASSMLSAALRAAVWCRDRPSSQRETEPAATA